MNIAFSLPTELVEPFEAAGLAMEWRRAQLARYAVREWLKHWESMGRPTWEVESGPPRVFKDRLSKTARAAYLKNRPTPALANVVPFRKKDVTDRDPELDAG